MAKRSIILEWANKGINKVAKEIANVDKLNKKAAASAAKAAKASADAAKAMHPIDKILSDQAKAAQTATNAFKAMFRILSGQGANDLSKIRKAMDDFNRSVDAALVNATSKKGITTALTNMLKGMYDFQQKMNKAWRNVLIVSFVAAAGTFVVVAVSTLKTAFNTISNVVKGAMSLIGNVITGGFSLITKGVKAVLGGLFNVVKSAIVAPFKLLGAAITGTIDATLDAVNMEPVRTAFDNITQGIDTTTDLLYDLQVAAAGTVSDYDLLRLSNLALAGATDEVADVFGTALPKLLELARVQAAATGSSVDYMFQSLITGVKRSSPLLIDNTGLVLKVGEANAQYAAELGKSVDELTAVEKQIALVNATLEAGQRAIDAAGGAYQTNSQRIAAIGITFQNLRTEYGLVFQPLLRDILAIGQEMAGGFRTGANIMIESLKPVVTFLQTVIASLREFGATLLETINLFFDWDFVLSTASAYVRGFFELLNVLAQRVAEFGRQMFAMFQPVITGLDIFNVSTQTTMNAVTNTFDGFFIGAIRGFAAFAAGIKKAATIILGIVADLAEDIASYLVGQSPPPVGALSIIDKGGLNVMLAWLQGFTGASLDPVAKVAQEVSDLMGEVATYGIEQVENRLASLDQAILPFQEKVDILVERLEAIEEPVKTALDAIENQQSVLIERFNAGNYALADTIKLYDAQAQSVTNVLEAQKATVAAAQYQLAMKVAEQAEERSLLNIQLARLKATEDIGDATERVAREYVPREREAAKGDSKISAPEAGTFTPPIPAGLTPTQEDQISELGMNFVEVFDEAFNENFTAADRADFVENKYAAMSSLSNLGETLQTATGSQFEGLGQFLKDKIGTELGGLSDEFLTNLQTQFNEKREAIMTWVTDTLTPIGEAIGESIITGMVDYINYNIIPQIQLAMAGKALEISNMFRRLLLMPEIANPMDAQAEAEEQARWREGFETVDPYPNMQISPQTTNSIVTGVQDHVNNMEPIEVSPPLVLAPVAVTAPRGSELELDLSSFDSSAYTQTNSLMDRIRDTVSTRSTEFLSTFSTTIQTAVQGMNTSVSTSTGKMQQSADTFQSNLIGGEGAFTNVANYLSPDGSDNLYTSVNGFFGESMPSILDQSNLSFTQYRDGILGLFANLGSSLGTVFVTPIISSLNAVITAFEETFESLTQAINKYLGDARAAGKNMPANVKGAYLAGIPENLTAPKLTRISMPAIQQPVMPTASDVQGAFNGGLFGGGLLRVGERGEELIASADKLAVFPNSFTRALDSMNSMINEPFRGGGNSTNNNTSNVNNTFSPTINTNGNALPTIAQLQSISRIRA